MKKMTADLNKLRDEARILIERAKEDIWCMKRTAGLDVRAIIENSDIMAYAEEQNNIEHYYGTLAITTIDYDVVKRYNLKPGSITPFSRMLIIEPGKDMLSALIHNCVEIPLKFSSKLLAITSFSHIYEAPGADYYYDNGAKHIVTVIDGVVHSVERL